MELTIYSKDFDDGQNVAGSGMNGLVFVEGNKTGMQFDNVDEAFKHVVKDNVSLDAISFCYQEDGVQKFKKFILAK